MFKREQFRVSSRVPEMLAGWRLQVPFALLCIASLVNITAGLIVVEGLGQQLAAAPFFLLAAQQASSSSCLMYAVSSVLHDSMPHTASQHPDICHALQLLAEIMNWECKAEGW
jgi:hypothetical protein